RGVEGAGAPDDPVDFVAFFEKKVGQVTSILTRDAGDQGALHPDAALAYSKLGSKHFSQPAQRPWRAPSVGRRPSGRCLSRPITVFPKVTHAKKSLPPPRLVLPRERRLRLQPGSNPLPLPCLLHSQGQAAPLRQSLPRSPPRPAFSPAIGTVS